MSVVDPQSSHPKSGSRESVQSHVEGGDYLAKRTLKKGTAGWVLLAGLGVSYVISGDYSGWNLGLAEGGFGFLKIAEEITAGAHLKNAFGRVAIGGFCAVVRCGDRDEFLAVFRTA